mmetsp:Transcript_21504/g.44300  ORF Transcript_21504/g.44300 Transcript_21504/m.44300 type:complete len:225 (+) Transcript_21504:55-729(+)
MTFVTMLSLAEQTATADLCSRYNLPSATCHRYTHEAIRLSHLPNCDGRRVYFTDFVVNVGLLEQSSYGTVVTSRAWPTPYDDATVISQCCESTARSVETLDAVKFSLNVLAVPTKHCKAPTHHSSISAQCGESPAAGHDVHHLGQLITNRTAVAAECMVAPGQHAAFHRQGRKSTRRSAQQRHLRSCKHGAVTALSRIAPCEDTAIAPQGSKCSSTSSDGNDRM